MLTAGEREVVDVSAAALGPFVNVVDLAEVPGYVAAGRGAAAIFRVQHDSLIGGGDPFGATQIQRALVVPVEHAQVVPGVGGHPDEVFHRQQCAAGGEGVSGRRGQLLDGGGGDDRDRQAVVGAEFRVAELAAQQR